MSFLSTIAEAARKAFVAAARVGAYAHLWPDGKTLPQRVEGWKARARTGIASALSSMRRAERDTTAVVSDIRAAEPTTIRGKIAGWGSRLLGAVKGLIRTPEMRQDAKATVEQALARVEKAAESVSRARAGKAVAAAQKDLGAGLEATVEAHLWDVFERQKNQLTQIASAEMVVAHHRAIVAATSADPEIVAYRWMLSFRHSVPDICDEYANHDEGLGRGVWSKGRVPPYKAHPRCMCLLLPLTKQDL